MHVHMYLIVSEYVTPGSQGSSTRAPLIRQLPQRTEQRCRKTASNPR